MIVCTTAAASILAALEGAACLLPPLSLALLALRGRCGGSSALGVPLQAGLATTGESEAGRGTAAFVTL